MFPCLVFTAEFSDNLLIWKLPRDSQQSLPNLEHEKYISWLPPAKPIYKLISLNLTIFKCVFAFLLCLWTVVHCLKILFSLFTEKSRTKLSIQFCFFGSNISTIDKIPILKVNIITLIGAVFTMATKHLFCNEIVCFCHFIIYLTDFRLSAPHKTQKHGQYVLWSFIKILVL